MSANTSSTDHIFNAIRRSLSEEFPELTLIYIICDEGQQSTAFKSKKHEFADHPSAKELIEQIETALDTRPPEHFGSYFIKHHEKILMGLQKKLSALAVCFINTKTLEYFEDADFSCKCTAYSACFETLHHLLKKDTNEDPIQTDPSREKINALRIKLMADCFAAMMLESTGTKGAIQIIIKKYCENTLSPAKDFHPENHPLLLAIDGLNVVYKDLKDEIPSKTGLIAHTYYMAAEIGNTYDDISLKQWIRFYLGAQDMAWAGYSNNAILSAAVYSSDSPYIRSNAHICAESLNTTPVPLKDTNIYNPFADDEKNERLHIRACKMAFMALLERINETEDPNLFFETARKQTKDLLKFKPMGWCAPALIEAENALRLFKETPTTEEEMIGNAFQASLSQIQWKDLKTLNRKFIDLTRKGMDIGPNEALEIIGDDEVYAHYRNAFELLK